MFSFKIKVASQVIQIETNYEFSYYACRHFMVDDEANFVVHITPEDIEKEREIRFSDFSLKQDNKSDNRIEFAALHRKICEKLIDSETIMIHGAAISLDTNSFLFCGKSGIGKTTHIFNWTDQFPKTQVINGDKPFVISRADDKNALVCGSPWAGKEKMSENAIAPLSAIVFLERSEENHIHRISFSEAFPCLYQQVFFPEEAGQIRKTLDILKSLDKKVVFYHFYVNNFKDDCIQVAYDALVRGIES